MFGYVGAGHIYFGFFWIFLRIQATRVFDRCMNRRDCGLEWAEPDEDACMEPGDVFMPRKSP